MPFLGVGMTHTFTFGAYNFYDTGISKSSLFYISCKWPDYNEEYSSIYMVMVTSGALDAYKVMANGEGALSVAFELSSSNTIRFRGWNGSAWNVTVKEL